MGITQKRRLLGNVQATKKQVSCFLLFVYNYSYNSIPGTFLELKQYDTHCV